MFPNLLLLRFRLGVLRAGSHDYRAMVASSDSLAGGQAWGSRRRLAQSKV
jgi:hypothetical protein